jgi:predicted phosphodiesterase
MKILFCADLHIRRSSPHMRKDDYQSVMLSKLRFIANEAQKHRAVLVIAGDIGDKSNEDGWPFWLLREVADIFSQFHGDIYAIPGQHDLPNHSLDKISKSGLYVLSRMIDPPCRFNLITDWEFVSFDGVEIDFFPFGIDIQAATNRDSACRIAVVHQLVMEDAVPDFMEGAVAARKMLRYGYDLVVAGDNHSAFHVNRDGRHFLSCGSMMRSRIDQQDHVPRVWLFDQADFTLTPISIPIATDVFDLKHANLFKSHEKKIEAFVTHLKTQKDTGLSFVDNVESLIRANNIPKQVTNIIWEIINE